MVKRTQLYNEVEINDSWADDWLNSEFATLVHGENENIIENNDNIAGDGDGGNDHDDGDNNDENNITHHELSEGNSPDNKISEEDRELIEDCIATEASLQVTGRSTANVLQFENLENEIYTCAPGENNTPCYMLMDNEFEVLVFPDMFPYGPGAFSTSDYHKTKLSMRKYFQQCLLDADGHFANNIEYLFCA